MIADMSHLLGQFDARLNGNVKKVRLPAATGTLVGEPTRARTYTRVRAESPNDDALSRMPRS